MNAKTVYCLAATALIGLASVSAQAAIAPALLGSTSPTSEASRVIKIGDNTRWVNVAYGETVQFVAANGQSFTIKFDGVRDAFDLNALAPAGALGHTVKAYVADLGGTRGV